jgi:hypothetical protein
MSLINDALKRAQESQKKNSPSGVTPLRPVESGSHGGIGWMMPMAVILLLAVAGIFIALALHKNKIPVVAAVQKNSTPPAAAIVPVPAPVISNATATASNAPADLPKLQGIMFDAAHPVAILNGQGVSVGDRAGVFQVKEITRTTVTLAAADGSQKTLELSQ